MTKLKKFLEERGYKFYRDYIDRANLCDWLHVKEQNQRGNVPAMKSQFR
jgi:hypothetical protein